MNDVIIRGRGSGELLKDTMMTGVFVCVFEMAEKRMTSIMYSPKVCVIYDIQKVNKKLVNYS